MNRKRYWTVPQLTALVLVTCALTWWLSPWRAYGAEQVHTVKAWTQPYGGCKEAWTAPHSRGARECRAHGWYINIHAVISPRHVLRHMNGSHCAVEDGSGPDGRPCFWFGQSDGNGTGRSYFIDRRDRTHYFHLPRRAPEPTGPACDPCMDPNAPEPPLDWPIMSGPDPLVTDPSIIDPGLIQP